MVTNIQLQHFTSYHCLFIKTITVDRITKVTAANKKNGADKQRLQFDNKRIFEEWETKLKEILSEEQYAKYVQSKNKK